MDDFIRSPEDVCYLVTAHKFLDTLNVSGFYAYDFCSGETSEIYTNRHYNATPPSHNRHTAQVGVTDLGVCKFQPDDESTGEPTCPALLYEAGYISGPCYNPGLLVIALAEKSRDKVRAEVNGYILLTTDHVCPNHTVQLEDSTLCVGTPLCTGTHDDRLTERGHCRTFEPKMVEDETFYTNKRTTSKSKEDKCHIPGMESDCDDFCNQNEDPGDDVTSVGIHGTKNSKCTTFETTKRMHELNEGHEKVRIPHSNAVG